MRASHVVSSTLALAALIGCDARRSPPDSASSPTDASALDARSLDARMGPDSGRVDTGLVDAGRVDAGLAPDAGRDATAVVPDDTGMDARALDASAASDAGGDAASARDAAGADAGSVGSVIECAPIVGSGASAGLLFSSNLWPGFRFQLTSSSRVRRVGLELTPDGASTVSAAIVALTGPSDTPDDPALGSGDVLVRTDVSVPAASRPIVVGGDLDFSLGAGWYALVFSTTTTGGTLPSGGGRGCVSSPASGYPFTIRQSDGMFILQGAQPHLVVELAP